MQQSSKKTWNRFKNPLLLASGDEALLVTAATLNPDHWPHLFSTFKYKALAEGTRPRVPEAQSLLRQVKFNKKQQNKIIQSTFYDEHVRI